jgi:outer membrane biosynthesis protein TonB
MKTKSFFPILAVILATVAVLNFQAISAGTPDKLLKNKEAVKKAELNRILSKSIAYPSEAVNKDLQCTVKVLAVIEPDGRVSGVRILQDIGGSCAKEVTRAICKLHFTPYLENGVASRYALVVNANFRLHE